MTHVETVLKNKFINHINSNPQIAIQNTFLTKLILINKVFPVLIT